MNKIITEPELLVLDAHGQYIPQLFCKEYLNYIVNKEELKEDIEICIEGVEHPEYWEAWEVLCDRVQLTNDYGQIFSIGYLPEMCDLWAIPEGYEYPEY